METSQTIYIGTIIKEQPTAQCFLDHIQIDLLGVCVSENGCVSLIHNYDESEKQRPIHIFKLEEHQTKLIEDCDELRAHIAYMKWQLEFQTGKKVIETRAHIKSQQEKMQCIEKQIKIELEVVFLLSKRLFS